MLIKKRLFETMGQKTGQRERPSVRIAGRLSVILPPTTQSNGPLSVTHSLAQYVTICVNNGQSCFNNGMGLTEVTTDTVDHN